MDVQGVLIAIAVLIALLLLSDRIVGVVFHFLGIDLDSDYYEEDTLKLHHGEDCKCIFCRGEEIPFK